MLESIIDTINSHVTEGIALLMTLENLIPPIPSEPPTIGAIANSKRLKLARLFSKIKLLLGKGFKMCKLRVI